MKEKCRWLEPGVEPGIFRMVVECFNHYTTAGPSARLINNKAVGAVGLLAELFKAGGDELATCISLLINTIWLKDCMPDYWNLSVLCPVLRKGDPSVCTNYRGISLLPVGGDELATCVPLLINTIWLKDCMPDYWNLSVLCPVLMKGDPCICTNYRGITLLLILANLIGF